MLRFALLVILFVSTIYADAKVKIMWSYKTNYSIFGQATLGKDNVYIGSADGNLYAFEQKTGKLIWKYTIRGEPKYVNSKPVIKDNIIYFSAGDGSFYALNKKTGALEWKTDNLQLRSSSPIMAKDGTIYVGSQDYNLYAINSDSGDVKWKFATSYWIVSDPALDKNGNIIFTSDDKKLYSVSPYGELNWSYKFQSRTKTSPLIVDDTIYLTHSSDNKLYAFDINGKDEEGVLKWSFSIDGSANGTPAISPDKKTLYISSTRIYDKSKLYAINIEEKTEKWSFELSTTDRAISKGPSVDKNGIIYFGSDDKKIYAINPNGKEEWSFATDAYIRAVPTIADNGTVYIGSGDYTFFAIIAGKYAKKEGKFTQKIDSNQLMTVVTIPKNSVDVNITLKSDKDLDLRLYDNNLSIVGYPNGFLGGEDGGANPASVNYQNSMIYYSGYNGINYRLGDESITINNTYDNNFTVKVYSYKKDGNATINYSWYELSD